MIIETGMPRHLRQTPENVNPKTFEDDNLNIDTFHKIVTMNPSSYRCLPCRLKSAAQNAIRPSLSRRFHVTPRFSKPNASQPTSDSDTALSQPAYPEVIVEAEKVRKARSAQVKQLAQGLKPYTAREKQLLAKRYTPEQMEAIEAGEEAISAEDMVKHGRLRGDAYRLQYIDDFATERPLVDRDVADPKATKQSIPGGLRMQGENKTDEHLLRLCKQTGMTEEEIRRIQVKNLVSHRVTNQTRMGKIHSIYFLTIAGNGQGMVGIGEGKAAEDEDGRRQAMMNAIRNMKPIPRYEERTIYGEVEAKVGATVVKLSSRPPGMSCDRILKCSSY